MECWQGQEAESGLDGVRWRDAIPRARWSPARVQSQLLLLGAEALDAVVSAVLEQGASEVGAQRCALRLFCADRGGSRLERFWQVPQKVPPRMELGELPWIHGELRAGRPVVFTRRSQLRQTSAEERDALAANDMRSAILMPLCPAGAEPLGWIGFVMLDHECAWATPQVEAARRYAELVAPALVRLYPERARNEQLSSHGARAGAAGRLVALPRQHGTGEAVAAALRILSRPVRTPGAFTWEAAGSGVDVQWAAPLRSPASALHSARNLALADLEPAPRRTEPAGANDPGPLREGREEPRPSLEPWEAGTFLAAPLCPRAREAGSLRHGNPLPGSWMRHRARRSWRDPAGAALARIRTVEWVQRAEREAGNTHDLLQATLDALGAQVAITDAQGKILAVNETWRSGNAGGSADLAVGGNYLQALWRESDLRPEAGPVLEAVPKLLRGERPELRVAYPCATPSGERWFQLRVTCFSLEHEARLVFTHEDVTELKQAEEQLREMAGELVQVQDTERRRIASVLHDGAAQQVFAAVLGVRAARRAGGAASEELAECQEVLEEALLQLRTLSHLLHPPLLAEAGLGQALSAYVESFSTRSGLALSLEGSEALQRLPIETEHALFRMVQEALLNVQRHSGSARARVLVEQDAREVRITVHDEGRGLPAATLPARPTVGLASMRQRLLQVGGSLELRSSAAGTDVCARVPRAPPPA